MIDAAFFIHYGTLAFTIILSGLGVAIGQGRIAVASLQATFIQPRAQQHISKLSLLSMALTETAGILGLVVVILLLFNTKLPPERALFISIAQAGAPFAIGLAGLVISIISALPAIEAILAVARQPFFNDKITNMMLITMSLVQSPLVFGFILVMLIHLQSASVSTLNDGFKLFSTTLCLGLGSIGPALGQGIFAKSACKSLGTNREAYKRIMTFSLLSQSIIETPIIFSLLASFLMLTSSTPSDLKVIGFIMTGICMGLCNLMSGISSGRTSASACTQIGLNHGNSALISRMSLLAQGLIDTFAIYGLLVGILLIFSPG
jgi:F-type H+-transporting ATPase subunit c